MSNMVNISSMKHILIVFLLFPFLSFAQTRNSITIFTVGNFNPTTCTWNITQKPLDGAPNENKDSLGGAIEFDRSIFSHVNLGLLYEQNPSNQKEDAGIVLKDYNSPDERLEASFLATEFATWGKSKFFIQEGIGEILTDNPGNGSYWSHNVAIPTGFGIEYPISGNFSIVAGDLLWDVASGCDNDPRCEQDWGVVQDAHLGVKYSF